MKLSAVAFAVMLPAMGAVADVDPGMAVGNPSAPVTIQVYSDFQCPSCKLFHDQTLPELMREYVNTGKVYLVYRDFPLPMHQYSRQAASYACAAAHLGLFQPVADALFHNQDSWAESGKVWECVASVLTLRQQKEVQALAASPEVRAEIQRDIEAGQRDAIDGTPTLIVSHGAKKYPLSGGLNYMLLRQLLNDIAR